MYTIGGIAKQRNGMSSKCTRGLPQSQGVRNCSHVVPSSDFIFKIRARKPNFHIETVGDTDIYCTPRKLCSKKKVGCQSIEFVFYGVTLYLQTSGVHSQEKSCSSVTTTWCTQISYGTISFTCCQLYRYSPLCTKHRIHNRNCAHNVLTL